MQKKNRNNEPETNATAYQQGYWERLERRGVRTEEIAGMKEVVILPWEIDRSIYICLSPWRREGLIKLLV